MGFNLSSASCLPLPLWRLQAARDEGYEVDEDLAQQDATSLFEVEFHDVASAQTLRSEFLQVTQSGIYVDKCRNSRHTAFKLNQSL